MSRSRLLLLSTFCAMLALPLSGAESGPSSATLTKDIEFTKAGSVSLTLDASVPEGAGPFATCILVHGGGFTKGDKTSFITPLFEPLTKAGFTWFTINYRLAPDHQWPAAADDVTAAVKWVEAHAAEYKVDPKRIALIGESAGGHLVAWTGVTQGNDLGLAAVVPFYAPCDVPLLMSKRTEPGGLGSMLGVTEMNDAAKKKFESISPVAKVKPGLPPFLLIHGDKDDKVPFEQSTIFQKQMQAAGNTCDLIAILGGIHGMGAWSKLGSDYQEQMVVWLRKTMK